MAAQAKTSSWNASPAVAPAPPIDPRELTQTFCTLQGAQGRAETLIPGLVTSSPSESQLHELDGHVTEWRLASGRFLRCAAAASTLHRRLRRIAVVQPGRSAGSLRLVQDHRTRGTRRAASAASQPLGRGDGFDDYLPRCARAATTLVENYTGFAAFGWLVSGSADRNLRVLVRVPAQ
jgi:hypothetical protein